MAGNSFVTVNFYGTQESSTGHVSITIGAQTYEQQWQPSVSWVGVLSGTLGQNDGIIREAPPNRTPVLSIEVPVTPEQLNIMERYAKSQLGVNNYGLLSTNCVQFVDSVFEAAAVPGDWRTILAARGGMPGHSPVEISIGNKSVDQPLAPTVPAFAHPLSINGANTISYKYVDPITHQDVRTVVLGIDPGSQTALTSITGGHVYPAGAVRPGLEMNGAEQVAYENHVRNSLSAAHALSVGSNGTAPNSSPQAKAQAALATGIYPDAILRGAAGHGGGGGPTSPSSTPTPGPSFPTGPNGITPSLPGASISHSSPIFKPIPLDQPLCEHRQRWHGHGPSGCP
jgi:hypothetical protein